MAQTGKHTAGPWSLSEKYHSVNVRAVDGPYVADCNASAAIGWETKQANARLIAAAPDLLEALRDLAREAARNIYPKPDVGPEHPYSILRRAEAAIAKAEGR